MDGPETFEKNNILSSGTATANHGVGIFGSPKSVDVQGTHVAPDPNDEAGGGRQKIPAFKEVQPQSSKDDAAVPNPKAVMEGGRQSVSFPNQAHSEVAANRATAVNVQHGFSSVVPDSNAAGVGGRHAASTSNDVHVETDTDAHAVSAATRNPDGHSGSSSDLHMLTLPPKHKLGADHETKISTTHWGEIPCICGIDVGRRCKCFQAFANFSASYPGSCQVAEYPNPNATSGGWPPAKDQISRARFDLLIH
ncbi:hypothetical protein Ancab_031404 [Ancistrocladus abbreviatus]